MRRAEPEAEGGAVVKVFVNAVAAKMGGALRHLRGFVEAWPADGPEVTMAVDEDVVLGRVPAHVTVVRVRLAGRAAQLIWHMLRVQGMARRRGADVLVSPLNFGPVRTEMPHVVFQRNALPFSPVYLARATRRGAWRAGLERALLARIMRGARRVVTPTAAMRDVILSACPAVPGRIFRVIPHAVEPGALASERMAADLARVLDADGAGQTRVLYVSHRGPCKNFETLLGAVRAARDAGAKLTLWLTIGADELASLGAGAGDGVVALGMIAPESIAAVYRAADIFAFPSLCESFGFPMLEAMACGLPTVAADTPVNREILQRAAVYHAPESVADARHALERVMADHGLRAALQAAAHARMAERDWSWRGYMSAVLAVVAEARGPA
jgi:glycosyltransferase involved in cell wall biosynthesis